MTTTTATRTAKAAAEPVPIVLVDLEARRQMVRPFERAVEQARAAVSETTREIERLQEAAALGPNEQVRGNAHKDALTAEGLLADQQRSLASYERSLAKKLGELAPFLTEERLAAVAAQKKKISTLKAAHDERIRKRYALIQELRLNHRLGDAELNEIAVLARGPGYTWSSVDETHRGRWYHYYKWDLREVIDENMSRRITRIDTDEWLAQEVKLFTGVVDDLLRRLG